MRTLVLVLLALLAGGGLYGGAMMLCAPDGSALGLDLALLPSWYTSDYRWPGLLLLVCFAAGPLVAGVLLLGAGWWKSASHRRDGQQVRG